MDTINTQIVSAIPMIEVLYQEGGFGISQVACLVNFSSRVLGSGLISHGFLGFHLCHGLWVLPFLCSGLRYFIKSSYVFGFSKSHIPCNELRSNNQLSNA